jgi:hypothetical protein
MYTSKTFSDVKVAVWQKITWAMMSNSIIAALTVIQRTTHIPSILAVFLNPFGICARWTFGPQIVFVNLSLSREEIQHVTNCFVRTRKSSTEFHLAPPHLLFPSIIVSMLAPRFAVHSLLLLRVLTTCTILICPVLTLIPFACVASLWPCVFWSLLLRLCFVNYNEHCWVLFTFLGLVFSSLVVVS